MKIQSGFEDLDKILGGGFETGSLISLGGRPAMGKTTFLLSICQRLDDQEVEYFYLTLECKKESLGCIVENGIDVSKSLDFNDVKNIEEFCEFVEDHKDVSKLFFIDSVGLLRKGSIKEVYEETSQIIQRLKLCAVEHDVCIVITSPLSRKVEERPGRRPMMTDFRDSGVIEDISDVVLFMLRRDYYDFHDKPGLVEIIVAKNRFGRMAVINMVFDRGSKILTDYEYPHCDPESVREAFQSFLPK